MKKKIILLMIILISSFSLYSKGLVLEEFAKTGKFNAKKLYLWDIAAIDKSYYNDIYLNSICPKVEDFRGNRFNGMVLYVHNMTIGKKIFSVYNGDFSDVLFNRLYSQLLTFQKRFHINDNEKGESGINYWSVKEIESAPMKIYVSPSIMEKSLESLKIDYNIISNSKIKDRPLIDEVRQIPGSNIYIGKMYFRVGKLPNVSENTNMKSGKHILFLWFALQKVE